MRSKCSLPAKSPSTVNCCLLHPFYTINVEHFYVDVTWNSIIRLHRYHETSWPQTTVEGKVGGDSNPTSSVAEPHGRSEGPKALILYDSIGPRFDRSIKITTPTRSKGKTLYLFRSVWMNRSGYGQNTATVEDAGARGYAANSTGTVCVLLDWISINSRFCSVLLDGFLWHPEQISISKTRPPMATNVHYMRTLIMKLRVVGNQNAFNRSGMVTSQMPGSFWPSPFGYTYLHNSIRSLQQEGSTSSQGSPFIAFYARKMQNAPKHAYTNFQKIGESLQLPPGVVGPSGYGTCPFHYSQPSSTS